MHDATTTRAESVSSDDDALGHAHAREKLRDTEQQLGLLIESVKDFAIFALAVDGTITSWNAGGEKLFGYPAADIVGQNFSTLFTPDDISSGLPAAQLREATLSGVANVEFWLIRKDGSRFRASGKINVLKRDASDELRGFVKIVHDITAQDAAYEHERTWSTRFQRAVLPATLPQVIGLRCDAAYEPGLGDAHVGGDWYDAVQLLDGRVLIAIGDVAGRGLEAAVVVGVVRQIMRGIAQLHADPALLLEAADRALTLEYPDVYVTAWVAILDLVTRTITYACAGHPPTLLASPDGSVRELGEPALPIGLREGIRGEAFTVDWSDGDTLVLYTDGLTEADRDILAGSALVHAAARQIGRAAWHSPAQDLRRAVVPTGSPDDVAILVLRVDFATFERNVDRWRLDTRDAVATGALRAKFTAALPKRDFSSADIVNAELVLGELIGHVVRRARGDGEVEIALDRSGPRTVLHVRDSGVGFRAGGPVPETWNEGGRGLSLIAATAADIQVDGGPRGGSHARAVLQSRRPVRFAQ